MKTSLVSSIADSSLSSEPLAPAQVVYNALCTDTFMAAFILRGWLKKKSVGFIESYPERPFALPREKDCFFAGVWNGMESFAQIKRSAKSCWWFLGGRHSVANLVPTPEVSNSQGECTALLVWRYCYPDIPPPWWVRAAQACDLWVPGETTLERESVCCWKFLRSLPRAFPSWNRVVGMREREAIERGDSLMAHLRPS